MFVSVTVVVESTAAAPPAELTSLRVNEVVEEVSGAPAFGVNLSASSSLVMADAEAGREVDAVSDQMVGFITAASHEPGTSPSERDVLVAGVIGKVWLTDVLTLLTGRMTVSQVLEDLNATITLVMSAGED